MAAVLLFHPFPLDSRVCLDLSYAEIRSVWISIDYMDVPGWSGIFASIILVVHFPSSPKDKAKIDRYFVHK